MGSRRQLCVLLLSLFAAAARAGQGADCYASCPAGERVQRLHNPGFTVGYSAARKQALWVAFKARPMPKKAQPWYRQGRFAADPRLIEPVKPWDYRGSGYDRGHLGPAFLLGALNGAAASTASYWMSNISPQKPRLNRLLMQRLEEAEAKRLTREPGGLWVLTGPLFGSEPQQTRGGVAIPEAFFRIWLTVQKGEPARACAFLIPQTVQGLEPLSDFAESVDAVEAASGLDFFAALPASAQRALEAGLPDSRWPLEEIADWPARYGAAFDKP